MHVPDGTHHGLTRASAQGHAAQAGQSGAAAVPQRFGRNTGGYLGDTIDIDSVLREIAEAALAHGWAADPFETDDHLIIPSWIRRCERPSWRLYISAGIHGDEPAGPLAVRELIRRNSWPDTLEVWACPCLNPTGFPLNRRENIHGKDLNRQYLHFEAGEVRAHVAWLKRQPRFDICLCLHEDWEANGFYLYELNPDGRPSHADAIIKAVAGVCPIDAAPIIEGRPALGGIIRPSADPLCRPQWPEAFYLLVNQSRHTYTLEAPSDFALDIRVRGLMQVVQTVVDVGPGA
jgi:protein MpaA